MAVTCSPVCVAVAFQIVAIFWSPGKVQVRVQGLIGPVPVSASVTDAWKPPGQELASA